VQKKKKKRIRRTQICIYRSYNIYTMVKIINVVVLFNALKIYGTNILYITRMYIVGYDPLLFSWVVQSRDNMRSLFFKL
jgi:hypothetical protein